jgi:hypothetical protein
MTPVGSRATPLNSGAQPVARETGLVLVIAGAGTVGLGNLMRGQAIVHSLSAAGLATHLVVRWYGGIEARGRTVPQVPEGARVTHTSDREPLSEVLEALRRGGVSPFLVLTDLPEAGEVPFAEIRRLTGAAVVCLNAYHGVPKDVDLCFLRGYAWVDNVSGPRVRAGVRYEVVRERVVALRPPAPWDRGTVETLLITLSAADSEHLTHQIAASLAPEVQRVVAVLGPLVEDVEERLARYPMPGNVTMLHNPSDLPERIGQADLVLTLGGQTTYEAMVLGRPVALLRTSANTRVADFFATHECVLDLGTVEEAPRALRRALRDPGLLRDRARRNWVAIDGCGAERIVDELGPFLSLPHS